MAVKKSSPGPEPAAAKEADIYAVQALFAGTASADQMKRGMKWILEEACKMRDLPWVAGGLEGQRATDFANGRRFAGHQILRLFETRVSPKT